MWPLVKYQDPIETEVLEGESVRRKRNKKQDVVSIINKYVKKW